MCGRVRLSSDYSELKIRLKFDTGSPGAELSGRLEHAADRADAGGDPSAGWQARSEDDARGARGSPRSRRCRRQPSHLK